jgi:hypothetical protein
MKPTNAARDGRSQRTPDVGWRRAIQSVGAGKRLFAEGTIPMASRMTESEVAPHGVMVASYVRAGSFTAGSRA